MSFLSANRCSNRELFRLLTYLNTESVIDQAIAFLQSDADLPERVHVGMHLKYFKHTWNAAERFALVKFYEESQLAEGGSSYPLYIMHAARDICQDLPLEEAGSSFRRVTNGPTLP